MIVFLFVGVVLGSLTLAGVALTLTAVHDLRADLEDLRDAVETGQFGLDLFNEGDQ